MVLGGLFIVNFKLHRRRYNERLLGGIFFILGLSFIFYALEGISVGFKYIEVVIDIILGLYTFICLVKLTKRDLKT